VDAIYGKKEEDEDIEGDYAQIYNDFNIVNSKNISKSIILINSVNIDASTITSSYSLEKSMFSKFGGAIVSGLPYTINCHSSFDEKDLSTIEPQSKPKSMLDMPLSLLFPNILSENGDNVSMVSIFKIVISIAYLSLKRILKDVDDIHQRKFCGLDLSNIYQGSHYVDNFWSN